MSTPQEEQQRQEESSGETPNNRGTDRSDVTTGDEQYDYVDKTALPMHELVTPGTSGTEATQAELNPAFYPKNTKPEALHNEAEKAGAEFPGGGHLQAAMAPEADPETGELPGGYDPTDPETANPPAPGAGLAGGHAAEVNTTEAESSGVEEPAEEAGPVDPDAAKMEQPPKNGSQEAWVDYAVNAKGAPREQADQLTRSELIEKYGS